MRAAIAFLLWVTAAASETPMTGQEFARYVKNKTLTYTYPSGLIGVERYNPDRSVVWQFDGGTCEKGIWYPQEDQICFLYEHDPDPKCWWVYRTDTGIRSDFVGGQALSVDNVLSKSVPLQCPGPPLLG